jgi:outer membrane protein assembly factor BamB
MPRLLRSSLLLAAVVVGAAEDPGWPQFRGPALDGHASGSGLIGGAELRPNILWKAQVGIGYTSLAVVGDRLYVAGHSKGRDTVRCFDAATGTPAKDWADFSYPDRLAYFLYEGGPLATPLVTGGALYGMSRTGLTYCLDAATGAVRWTVDLAKELGAKEPEWGFAGSPRLIDGTLVVAVGRFGTGLDPATGRIRWRTGTGPAGYASAMPAVVGGTTHLLIASDNAYALLRAADGAVAWELPFRSDHGINAADAVIEGGQAFISSTLAGVLVNLDPAAQRERWRNKALRTRMLAAVKHGGHLYGFDGDTLKCLAWDDGSERWAFRGLGESTAVVADGHLVILAKRGELVIAKADPAGYAEVARAKVLEGRCWTAPAIAGSRIFCRNAKGDLVAVALR